MNEKLSLSVALVLLFALFALPLKVSAAAEVTVSATVDRNSLNPEDTLTFSVSIGSSEEVAISDPSLPKLNDFEILNEWTSQSRQAVMVATPQGPEFKQVSTMAYNFMLMPKRQGQLTIGSVEVVVDGRAYSTKPISIKVAPGAGVQQQPRAGRPSQGSGAFPPPGLFDEEEDDIFSQLLRRGQQPPPGSRTLPIDSDEAFFINVETDKTSVYAGEQVTASFYLYTRGLIRELDTLKYPALKGFWKEDIEIATHLNFETEVVNGIPYKKALLASYALFPIKEGSATIDPYQVKCSVVSGDVFGGLGLGRPYTFTKSSKPVKITVKPIPAAGRPTDYSGAVGEFQVTARVEDRVVVENQPMTLKVRFEGRGNAKLIDLPPLTWPEGLELYDQQDEARFFRTGTSFKEFRILLIPRRDGEFTIPAISVSVFDPVRGVFEKKTTEPITLRVSKGVGQKSESQGLPEDGKDSISKKTSEPRLITELPPPRMISGSMRTALWIVIYLFAVGALVWHARNELGWGEKKKNLIRELKSRLRRVEDLGGKGDWRGVGTEMTNTLYFVLGAIAGERGANMEMEKLLMKAPPSLRRELGESLQKQLETYQMLTFAPDVVVEGMKKKMVLSQMIKEMEELLLKAVSLGLSAERSSGSGSGPKAS